MYGYEIYRSVNGGPFNHITSSRTCIGADDHALAGNRYAYFVRPFDLAGNHGPDSNIVEITVEPEFQVPPDRDIGLDGQVEAETGGRNLI
jgi:hypothetical protein